MAFCVGTVVPRGVGCAKPVAVSVVLKLRRERECPAWLQYGLSVVLRLG